MDAIAVVDDREEMRGTVVRIISRQLRKQGIDWDVIAAEPLEKVEDYLSWLDENEIRVLVLDEKLNEVTGSSGARVEYPGHAVANFLRDIRPDLPQFIVTSIRNIDELDDSAADLDAIIERDDFGNKAPIYVARMVRAGKSYLDRYESELRELDQLSAAVVAGSADPESVERLHALRGAAQKRHVVETMEDMRAWISSAEALCEQLKNAIDEAGRDQ